MYKIKVIRTKTDKWEKFELEIPKEHIEEFETILRYWQWELEENNISFHHYTKFINN